MCLILVLLVISLLPHTNRHQNNPFKRWFSCLCSWVWYLVASCTSMYKEVSKPSLFKRGLVVCAYGFGAFSRILYFRVQIGTKTNIFNGGLVVYVYGLGAFRCILYFRVQTGTKPNLFNGGLVIYVYGLGAFSRILYFRVQTDTKTNLSYRGFSCLCLSGLVLLAESCTSGYK